MVIETKFQSGNVAWMMKNNKPQEVTVDRVTITEYLNIYNSSFVQIKYYIQGTAEYCTEFELFHTKEDLIKSL